MSNGTELGHGLVARGFGVKVNGIDVRKLDPARIREHIALRSPKTILFTGTIREVMRDFFVPAAIESESYVMEFIRGHIKGPDAP
jgi:ABC-type multidrug transport system fused ATPase/permease subunit